MAATSSSNSTKEIQKDIRILQLIRAALFIVGVIALIYFLREVTVPVTVSYMTKDALVSQDQTVFVSGLRNWFNAPIGYMAALALLVSAVVAVLRVTKYNDDYAKQVQKGSDGLKWVELGVTSAIIFEVVALLSGVSDAMSVKVGAGLVAATCALGWLADRQNDGVTKKADWRAFYISLLTGVLSWLFIIGSFAFTYVYGVVRMPWYSYALAGAVLAGFVGLAVNQMLNIRRYDQWKKYAFTERNYLLIDIALKTAFAVILVVGLKG